MSTQRPPVSDAGGIDDDESSLPAVDARTAVLGLQSGLLATVVMTLFRLPISRSPPPTATFWAKYVAGGRPADHTWIGLVLHVAYGMSAGVVFAALSPARSGRSAVATEASGVVRGVVFGLVLSGFGARILLAELLDVTLEPDERFIFHLSHVVYGLTLGAWYGSSVE